MIYLFILLCLLLVYLVIEIVKGTNELKRLTKISKEQDIEIERLIKICEKEIDKQFKDRKKYYEDL